LNGLFVVSTDGLHLRQLVSHDQLTQWARKPFSLGYTISWAPDGSKLLFSVRGQGCRDDGVYRVNADGSDLRPLWRRPFRLQAEVQAEGWSPDSSGALFEVSRNDGDCYSGHIESGTLMSIDDGMNEKPRQLLTLDGWLDGTWSTDGVHILYSLCSAGYPPCNLGVFDVTTRRAQRLTHPANGRAVEDGIWSSPTDVLFGRGLSLVQFDAATGHEKEVLRVQCPRRYGQCTQAGLVPLAVSSDGAVLFDAVDPGSGSDARIGKRYVFQPASHQLTQLPDPYLNVDDIRFG
jgi:hypothetical protein